MRRPLRLLITALLISLSLSAVAAAKPPAVGPAPPLPLATPESQGMSSERLERLHAEVQRFIDEGKYAGAVRIDLAKGDALGSVGQFGWSGAATTYANLDPKEGTVALLFVQHFPIDEHELFWRFSTLAYAAIVD